MALIEPFSFDLLASQSAVVRPLLEMQAAIAFRSLLFWDGCK